MNPLEASLGPKRRIRMTQKEAGLLPVGGARRHYFQTRPERLTTNQRKSPRSRRSARRRHNVANIDIVVVEGIHNDLIVVEEVLQSVYVYAVAVESVVECPDIVAVEHVIDVHHPHVADRKVIERLDVLIWALMLSAEMRFPVLIWATWVP